MQCKQLISFDILPPYHPTKDHSNSYKTIVALTFSKRDVYKELYKDVQVSSVLTFYSGTAPEDAEIQFLQKVKWLDRYGVHLFEVHVSHLTVIVNVYNNNSHC